MRVNGMVVPLLISVAVVACTEPATNVDEQALCTVTDWETGNCPDTLWRVNFTRNYALSVDPYFVVVGVPHCTHVEETILCHLDGTTILVDCRWSSDGSVQCEYY